MQKGWRCNTKGCEIFRAAIKNVSSGLTLVRPLGPSSIGENNQMDYKHPYEYPIEGEIPCSRCLGAQGFYMLDCSAYMHKKCAEALGYVFPAEKIYPKNHIFPCQERYLRDKERGKNHPLFYSMTEFEALCDILDYPPNGWHDGPRYEIVELDVDHIKDAAWRTSEKRWDTKQEILHRIKELTSGRNFSPQERAFISLATKEIKKRSGVL